MKTTARMNGSQADADNHFHSPNTNHFAIGLLRVAAQIARKAPRTVRPGHASVVSLGELEGAAFDDHVTHAFARLEQGLR
jgi:hypothetical protein